MIEIYRTPIEFLHFLQFRLVFDWIRQSKFNRSINFDCFRWIRLAIEVRLRSIDLPWSNAPFWCHSGLPSGHLDFFQLSQIDSRVRNLKSWVSEVSKMLLFVFWFKVFLKICTFEVNELRIFGKYYKLDFHGIQKFGQALK